MLQSIFCFLLSPVARTTGKGHWDLSHGLCCLRLWVFIVVGAITRIKLKYIFWISMIFSQLRSLCQISSIESPYVFSKQEGVLNVREISFIFSLNKANNTEKWLKWRWMSKYNVYNNILLMILFSSALLVHLQLFHIHCLLHDDYAFSNNRKLCFRQLATCSINLHLRNIHFLCVVSLQWTFNLGACVPFSQERHLFLRDEHLLSAAVCPVASWVLAINGNFAWAWRKCVVHDSLQQMMVHSAD